MYMLQKQTSLIAILLIVACPTVSAWTNQFSPKTLTSLSRNGRIVPFLQMTSNDAVDSSSSDGDDDDGDIPPGKMRISEIKSELELRKVSFSDCFDRESLERRLLSARSSGVADPSIIDKFNKNNLEATFKGEKLDVSDDDISKAVGADGTLPGGMPPDMLKELMSNPELMELLQSVKMQDAMKLMMTGGQEALQKAMEEDPETYEIVMKLNAIMGKGMGGGSSTSGGGAPPPSDAFQ
mmetsp:Transcript_12954/g.18936  ORF Transcript_12954/g.18936 Transcript_12954/m.18936 type:complete len:238 (-) Transcript_12954:377-1090(-)